MSQPQLIGRSIVRAIHGLGIAGLTTTALVALGAPAFAATTVDAPQHATDAATTAGHPSLLSGLQKNAAVPGAVTTAGTLDPLGSFAFPKL
jgi:hypothetical protein